MKEVIYEKQDEDFRYGMFKEDVHSSDFRSFGDFCVGCSR
jgi:hypothetical protein